MSDVMNRPLVFRLGLLAGFCFSCNLGRRGVRHFIQSGAADVHAVCRGAFWTGYDTLVARPSERRRESGNQRLEHTVAKLERSPY